MANADTIQDQVSEADEALIRSEMAQEIFEAEAPGQAAEALEDDVYTSSEREDETQGLAENTSQEAGTPAFQETLNAINARLATLEGIEVRLKQTERRLGSVQNEVFNAKKPVEKVKDAPTEAEVAEAAKTEKAWDSLKEDFPDWAVAIESKIAASQSKIPDVGGLRKSLEEVSSTMVTSPALERRLVSMMHPGWESTIQTSEYKTWLATQPAAVQDQALNGETADEAVDVLNKFREYRNRSNQSTPSNVNSARKTRLAKSVAAPAGRATRPVKSEADMSTPELRQTIANEVWNE